jgi:hypothetical protein
MTDSVWTPKRGDLAYLRGWNTYKGLPANTICLVIAPYTAYLYNVLAWHPEKAQAILLAIHPVYLKQLDTSLGVDELVRLHPDLQ